MDYSQILERCIVLLDAMREMSYSFFNFLFEPVVEISGTPDGYVFLFGSFVALLVTRILLAVNS